MSSTTSGLTFAALSFDCASPAALAGFWGQFLGRPVSPGAVPGDMAVEATDPASGPRLLFHGVSKAVTATTGSRPVVVTEHYDEEIERVTGLGATKVTETVLPAVRWITFADPRATTSTWSPGCRSSRRPRTPRARPGSGRAPPIITLLPHYLITLSPVAS